jgi:hypothetical protein
MGGNGSGGRRRGAGRVKKHIPGQQTLFGGAVGGNAAVQEQGGAASTDEDANQNDEAAKKNRSEQQEQHQQLLESVRKKRMEEEKELVVAGLERLRESMGGRPGVDVGNGAPEEEEPPVDSTINDDDDVIDFSVDPQAEGDATTRKKATSYQPPKKSIVGEHLGVDEYRKKRKAFLVRDKRNKKRAMKTHNENNK